jgi:hypothetical protein
MPQPLRITEAQMAALTQASIERFLKDAARHIESLAADLRLPPPRDSLADARRAYDRCAAYGIDTTKEVLRFAAFELLFGQGFERSGAFEGAEQVLADTDLPGWARLDALQAMAPEGARRDLLPE